MNTDDNEIEAPTIIAPPAADSLAILADILRLVVDNKKSSERIRSLQQREAAALRAEANLAPAKAQHDAAISNEWAEIDKRKAALAGREIELNARAAQLDERERERADYYREIANREVQLKGRLMRELGLSFNEKLQALPSFEELDRIRYQTLDAHFDQQQPALEAHGDLVLEPVPDSPTGRPPLMRSVPAPRSAAARRAERRAADGLA